MVLTTLMLTAALLAGQEPKAEAQKGWIVEIRGFTYHAQTKPKEIRPGQPVAPKLDMIEGMYVDDLRTYFDSLKKQKP
jgi:hypothetical protein